MPPQKKRDKEIKESLASNQNGSSKTDITGGNQLNQLISNGSNSDSAGGSAASAAEAIKLNGHQQEQELFLQAFEKPTQIYRFLRNRHITSPIFLQRTLSYMKERMSRNNRKRSAFKVNSMLEMLTQKTQTLSNNYLNIIYNGLFEKNPCSDHSWQAGDTLLVESTLYKITKSKRKDSTSDFQEILSYNSAVIYNPPEKMEQLAAISIPAQAMHPLGDQHTIYKLLFRIKVNPTVSNGEVHNEETPSKLPKYSHKIYGCELIVYEKNIGCLPEGDYEAALQELNCMSIKSFSPKKRSWETLPDNYIPISMKFDVFTQFPTLKFRLTWSAIELPKSLFTADMEKYGRFNEMAAACQMGDMPINDRKTNHINNNNNNSLKDSANNINNNSKESLKGSLKAPTKPEKTQIVYNFLYSNNTRQQTEYTQEVICPWCGLDCMRLYSLLKHLKLCHARFNFTYQPAAGNGARIDVTINDAYDGSYAGSPYDLAGPSGCSFARTCGPVRRTTVTNLLVCRPRRQKTGLDEFLVLDEDELSNQRPYITGHNRLYHHTETCLPVHPKELDIDSEGESDPLWLRQKTIQMIDEFTDVNEGEKELMKLWNLHVMKHGFVGDCQLPLACEMFLDVNGHEIIRKNIYRNFILHMCSLFDYGLVSPETVYKTVQKLQGILSKYSEGQEMMSQQRAAQLKFWLEIGIHKQDEQKLKSPLKSLPPPPPNPIIKTLDEDISMDNKSAMQPPSKRSNTAIKRSSGNLSNAINGDKSSESKSVARKSAISHDDDTKSKMNSLKRNSNGEANRNRTVADAKAQAAKRRLSTKDDDYDDEAEAEVEVEVEVIVNGNDNDNDNEADGIKQNDDDGDLNDDDDNDDDDDDIRNESEMFNKHQTLLHEFGEHKANDGFENDCDTN
uniref:VEFS-Box domain-containing protein n=1 Tax=Glossina austeni TaxID=7395 RepID=A0A1A9VKX1_GLOAU